MIVPSVNSLSPTYDHFTVADEELKVMPVDEMQKAISRICISSRAVVKMSKTKDETNFLLHGSQEGVKKARTLIKQKFRSKSQITFDIPSRSRRAVVGTKGSTVRAIKRKNNVDIKIDRRRLCKPFDLEKYHDGDQLAIFKQDPSGDVRYVASVEVKVMGSQVDCMAAKKQILEVASLQVVEFCHFPHGLYRYEARKRAEECFNDVSIFTGYSPIDTLAVEGHKDTVYEVMKLLRSFADLECDSIVIPTALRYTGFMSSLQNVETEDLKENEKKAETKIIIKGQRADVTTACQMIVEHIAKYFSHRLMLIDLHGGNIEHVRRVLSLYQVRERAKRLLNENSVFGEYPEKDFHNVEYIEVFGLQEKDVMLSISQPLLKVSYLTDGCKMEFHCDGDEDCKDMITLFDETERVEKTVTLINQILQCEKEQQVYTVVFEIPSLLVYDLKSYYYLSDFKEKYGIKPHIVRKDGQPNKPTWSTSTSDVSIVTLTGNRVYVDALKCEIEEKVRKFIPYMFTEVCDIDESFFARVSGRDFSNMSELERSHKVKTSLGTAVLTYGYLFNDSSGSFDDHHRVQIMGGSSTSVIQAKESLSRLLETIKKSTETATFRVPKVLRYDIRNQLDMSRYDKKCSGVDCEFRDDEADGFITLDLHGCQPDLRNAVERTNSVITEHIEKEKDKT
ncbi:uncharacterized protein CXQ87_001786 [Candidozyma duobushaemuli]|uniref:K Homology domain-containing protein n=1 Tax=Candidozyma duobushaemuli TaxID=1231522 RepID=A0A2V1A765_9ASCO|nr:uncharacterized protein CXQ87_001786 [[Candida] duobushaemulonis]PVH13672.1 hypothetical protein CXQ87_001786 [[Candida] duobushaemulonis]